MANNETSFRYPLPENPKDAIRLMMNGLKDLNDAVAALKSQQGTATSTSTTTVVQSGGGSAGVSPDVVSYVNAIVTALDVKSSCRLATAAALPAYTYSGAVITANANGALTVDGIAVALNDRVLVKDGAAGSDNGIYVVTAPGDAGTPFVLTRSGDCNSTFNYITGSFTVIEEGTANKAFPFIVSTQGAITIDTTSVTWSKIAAGATEVQVNGVDTTAQTPINFQNGTNTTVSNPSVGNIQVAVPTATGAALGVSKPDGSTITVSGGVLTAATATGATLGIVRPDNSSIVVSSGVLTAAGGSGVGPYAPMIAPNPSDFTWTNQLSTTTTSNTQPDRLTFVLPTNATDPNWRLFIYNTALPSPPFTVRGAFCITDYALSYTEMTIGLRDSASGKLVDLNLNVTGAHPDIRKITFNSVTSVNSNSTILASLVVPDGPLFWLKITDDGVTRKFWCSANGCEWRFIDSEATGTFITPNQCYIGCANFTGIDRTFACYDWLMTNAVV